MGSSTVSSSGLETVIGPVPDGVSPEEAYEVAAHSDDREAYDAVGVSLRRGEPVEVEYRLVGFDGRTKAIRKVDVVARHGGDEFLIFLSDLERDVPGEAGFRLAAEVVAAGRAPPTDFVPLAERTGLVGAVSDWVIARRAGKHQHGSRRGSISTSRSTCRPHTARRPEWLTSCRQRLPPESLSNAS